MMAAFESICLKASAFEDNVNIVMELIHLMDIRLDEINVMARRPKIVDLITPTPSYVGNKRLPNINAPHSVSKGLGNCTKRKEVSPPAEQESCTHGISSSSSPHVKDPIVRKKAHNACEISITLQPSTDVAMVDQPLIGSPTSNMFVDNGQWQEVDHPITIQLEVKPTESLGMLHQLESLSSFIQMPRLEMSYRRLAPTSRT